MNFVALPVLAQVHIINKLSAEDRQNLCLADTRYRQIEKMAGYRNFTKVELIAVNVHNLFSRLFFEFSVELLYARLIGL